MCGRYQFDADNAEMAAMRKALPQGEWQSGEIFPTNAAPILTAEYGAVGVRIFTWGFPRFGGQSGAIINARAETALEKKTFRDAVLTRRCVIPSTGFYEWHRDTKQKYRFNLPGTDALYMAGLYRTYEGKGRYVILTTAPNASMQDVHDRMPLVLPPEAIRAWLGDRDQALALLHAVPPMLVRNAV